MDLSEKGSLTSLGQGGWSNGDSKKQACFIFLWFPLYLWKICKACSLSLRFYGLCPSSPNFDLRGEQNFDWAGGFWRQLDPIYGVTITSNWSGQQAVWSFHFNLLLPLAGF